MTARLQLRSVDGSEREIPLETAAAGDLSAAAPCRTFRSHRNLRHYSGWYWSPTTGDHVIYESRLELARLLLADADPDIVRIAAQPFLLIEGTETKPRRHVPDYDGELWTVVDLAASRATIETLSGRSCSVAITRLLSAPNRLVTDEMPAVAGVGRCFHHSVRQSGSSCASGWPTCGNC